MIFSSNPHIEVCGLKDTEGHRTLIVGKKSSYAILYYMNIAGLKNVVWREDKHYVAQSLNVDVSSFGDTKKEALANLREALELYFEDAPSGAASSVEEPEIVSI